MISVSHAGALGADLFERDSPISCDDDCEEVVLGIDPDRSGAIGIEFASFYNDMGVDVTVVEMLDREVPVEDAEGSAFLEKSLTKQGMTIMTGAGVEDLKVTAKGVTAKIKDSKGKVTETEFSHCITAIGIVPNAENVGLEKLVEMDRGFIQIDDYGRTKSKGLWAIGDCTPGPWLAHKASHEGVVCVEKIAGYDGVHPFETHNIPGCTYCRPQIASVGLTEAAAKEKGRKVKVCLLYTSPSPRD